MKISFSDLNYNLQSIFERMSRDIDEIFKYKMYGKLHCPQKMVRQNQNPTNDIDA